MSAEPRILFKKVDYTLDNLLTYIDIGDIGLPDIQRPFVWPATKVRDLFDSMYRGFPIGYLLFWSNSGGTGTKQIGKDEKGHKIPNLLIVDGQQRLTSLYAVFRGKEVLDDDFRHKRIEIAFRPRDGSFEVADAAIRKDPEFISSISEIWSSSKSSRKLVNDFIGRLNEKRPLTDEEEEAIAHNLDRLFDLQKYPFTALEIAATVDEEQVADIFVRINSQGVTLKQGDFILTLLSVFWDEGRRDLEHFCYDARIAPGQAAKPSSFNHFIHPDPEHLLRAAVAFGFWRGRLKSVYQLLRGKDLDTEQYSEERRVSQFEILKDAQAKVLDLTQWHQFFGALIAGGFRSGEMVSSKNALIYCYAIYLIGRLRFGLPYSKLDRLIGRWFFFVSLTGRYTGSVETQVEADLGLLRRMESAEQYVDALDSLMTDSLTNDFWSATLPRYLETSSTNSPYYFAYLAAQNRLGAPILFSTKKVGELLDPTLKLKVSKTHRHHLFPKAWLDRQGISDKRNVNQIANFAITEWPDNIEISDEAPTDYVPLIRKRYSDDQWVSMCADHALPENWEAMEYEAFLDARRRRMAEVIRRGFEGI